MSQIQLLHLEDSSLDAELIRVRLAKDGLQLAVHRVVGHDDFLEAIRARRFDLILADYSIPGFDGLEALEYCRTHARDTPFLFVSGVLGEEVAIETLKQGATDYVLKHRLDRLGPAVRRALTEARERAERRRAEAALRESERQPPPDARQHPRARHPDDGHDRPVHRRQTPARPRSSAFARAS